MNDHLKRVARLEAAHSADIFEELSEMSDEQLQALVADGDARLIAEHGEEAGRRRIAGRGQWLDARSDAELREIASGRLPC